MCRERSYPKFNVPDLVRRQHPPVVEADVGEKVAFDRLDLRGVDVQVRFVRAL